MKLAGKLRTEKGKVDKMQQTKNFKIEEYSIKKYINYQNAEN